ncbi:hypothetical protein AD998_19565 [bacterium 336/3]|nr:hypothetical protein AD998_19565 [bacterium 336/3]
MGAVTKTSVKKPLFYTVKQGDTLWNISQKYQGLSIEKIKQLNPTLKGTNLVTGQKIRVG